MITHKPHGARPHPQGRLQIEQGTPLSAAETIFMLAHKRGERVILPELHGAHGHPHKLVQVIEQRVLPPGGRDEPLGPRNVQGRHIGVGPYDLLLPRLGQAQPRDHRTAVLAVLVQHLSADRRPVLRRDWQAVGLGKGGGGGGEV